MTGKRGVTSNRGTGAAGIRPALRAVVVCAASLAAGIGCSSSPKTAAAAPPPAAHCSGTLGFETGPLTRAVRKKLALPADTAGAAVTTVLPGGPAQAAGLRAGDVVEQIGDERIGNDCDADKASFHRACQPTTLRVWRSGSVSELTLTPVDEVPFLDKACREGSADACFRAAWLKWNRHVESPDVLSELDAACKAGSAEACAYEGLQLSENPDRASEARPLDERSCDLGSAAGCANLAYLYAAGKSVAKDDRRAASLYRKSCDLGDAQGCYNAGVMADDGRGVREDPAAAAADYAEGCSLGSSTACTNLGFLYEHGRGVRQDKARAVELYQKGCEGSSCRVSNLGGCLNVGRALRDGIGVAVDEPKAAEIFREACHRKADSEDIHAEENGARACSLLGGLYIAGDGIERDLDQGREFSILGCDRGDAFGCFNAAVCYGSSAGASADPAKAASYFDRACRLRDGESCHQLARAYESGKGVPRDAARAKTLEKDACEFGFTDSCPKARPKTKKKS